MPRSRLPVGITLWGEDPITMAHEIHYLVNMKNKISRHNRGMLLVMAVLFSAFMAGGVSQAWAHDGYYQNQNGYYNQGGYQNQNGYYDQNGNYHPYGYYHHHRGYWNHHNGVRLFINVG